MTLHNTIIIIAALINLLAMGGFAWWIIGWIRSLKGAVDAQKETISAQKDFIQGLKTLIDEFDFPKMHQRFQAYRQIVDQEKEAVKQDLEARYQDERDKLAQFEGGLKIAEKWIDNFVSMFVDVAPYVSEENRRRVLEETRLTDSAKLTLQRVFETVPDMSNEQRHLTYLEALILSEEEPKSQKTALAEALSLAREKMK